MAKKPARKADSPSAAPKKKATKTVKVKAAAPAGDQ